MSTECTSRDTNQSTAAVPKHCGPAILAQPYLSFFSSSSYLFSFYSFPVCALLLVNVSTHRGSERNKTLVHHMYSRIYIQSIYGRIGSKFDFDFDFDKAQTDSVPDLAAASYEQ